ncbi:hypothetical protein T261_8495 [Streptomyces lydicus]|nr:hypothetical protein T261_8495 [Streptomyces lydicus]
MSEGIGIVDGMREKRVNIESDLAVRKYAVPNLHVADPNITVSAKKLMKLFNASFPYMLRLLDQLYATPMDDVEEEGHSNRHHMERVFIALMQGILYPIAELMMNPRTRRGRRSSPADRSPLPRPQPRSGGPAHSGLARWPIGQTGRANFPSFHRAPQTGRPRLENDERGQGPLRRHLIWLTR